eukprot:scaffold14519_cov135-Isochrysis_galbana.AAC.2
MQLSLNGSLCFRAAVNRRCMRMGLAPSRTRWWNHVVGYARAWSTWTAALRMRRAHDRSGSLIRAGGPNRRACGGMTRTRGESVCSRLRGFTLHPHFAVKMRCRTANATGRVVGSVVLGVWGMPIA